MKLYISVILLLIILILNINKFHKTDMINLLGAYENDFVEYYRLRSSFVDCGVSVSIC